jgi:hypothetical protein
MSASWYGITLVVSPLSELTTAILASAYQLDQARVAEDALTVAEWTGPEARLIDHLQERHGWTAASEYAPYYLASLHKALQSGRRDGSAHH